MKFHTDYRYSDRITKAKHVYKKYNAILNGRILDVGADECYLKEHLGAKTQYTGIGLGGNPDIMVDLERGFIPFPDDSFDCVLCLDVLEHLENIHETFAELCRVTRNYLIISLPNPYRDFYDMLRSGKYEPGRPMKFYGLPAEKPEDRHKWFFSFEEAENFIRYNAEKHGMEVLQIDGRRSREEGSGMKGRLRKLARNVLFKTDLNMYNLYAGTLWAVLKKNYV